jgi:hypothetical protein
VSSWHSYPKIYNVGHAAVSDVLSAEVYVEEKVDGSQFSFGVIDGELKCRSKGKEQYPQTDKMFERAVASVLDRKGKLREGWTYSGEYLQKPKHNTISYSSIPVGCIMIFDIRTGEEEYLGPGAKLLEANRIGYDCVPVLASGVMSLELMGELLEAESRLGGTKVEGVVLKPVIPIYGRDGKALMAKYVSEAFKERNNASFRNRNPTGKDTLALLCDTYRAPARWEKAANALRDAGELERSPRDIPKIMATAQADLQDEEGLEIRDALWKWAWPQIRRKSVAGLAEWYKEKLLKEAFDDQD